jgi:hypothetical protein
MEAESGFQNVVLNKSRVMNNAQKVDHCINTP